MTAARPLQPLTEQFAATRDGLHLVAERIVAPARKPPNEISLRATPGGFGTPPFEHDGAERQVRVEGTDLVYAVDGTERRARMDSLAAGAELVADLLEPSDELGGGPLGLADEAAAALAAWFALGDRVLEQLRSEAQENETPTIVRLWPEHFDLAIETGDEAARKRANLGFSPGDDDHSEPYLYVGPWSATVEGPLWNARGFAGAELAYAELVAAADPQAAALDFARERLEALRAL